MAKEIALKLKITSQGEEKVISNIGELEAELQNLQTTLKTLDFGSKAFKEATKNIAILRTKIDEVDKASEGIGAEKKFRAFGDAINILTGSFQVASGAIGLFIDDEKSLEEVQKAETAALNVLNVALGVNAINTAIVESATLRKSIADKVVAFTTGLAAAAQKAFNAVLAANPIGLAITAIAALATGYALFTRETKKSTNALDELKIKTDTINELGSKGLEIRNEEIKKIQTLTAISELENLKKKDRVRVLKEIQAQYPNYLKNQNLEKVSLEDIKKANEGLINSITKVAKARASADKLAEIQTKKLEVETNRQLGAQNQIQQQAEAYNLLDASQTQKRIVVLTNLGKIRDQEAAKAIKQLDIQEKAVLGYIKENDLVDSLVGNFTKAEEATKDFATNEISFIEQTISVLDKLIGRLNDLGKEELSYSTEIIKKQEEVISKQEASLTNLTNVLTTKAKKLQQELFALLRETIPTEEDAAKLTDGYIDLFDTIGNLYQTGAIKLEESIGFDDFVKKAEAVIPGLGEKLKLVGDDGKKAFVEFFNEIKYRVKDIQEIQKTLKIEPFGDLETTNKLSKVEDAIFNLRKDSIKLGLTETDIKEKSLDLINTTFGLAQKQKQLEDEIAAQRLVATNATEKTKTTEDNKLKALEAQLIKQKEISTILLEQVNRSSDFYLVAEKINEQANKNAEQIQKNLTERRKALTRDELEGLKEYFASNASQFQTLFTDIALNINDYIAKIGVDGVKELIGSVESNFDNLDTLSRQQLEKLQSYLLVVSNELGTSLGEDGKLFITLLDKISEKIKKLPTETEVAFTKTISNVKKVADLVLSSFSQISSQLSSVIQSQNSLLLEQLDYQQQVALKNIGEANSENAEENKRITAERLAVEKEFQKKKFDVEKTARVQELQFALANAIAQGAQAIINAYATLPTAAAIPFSIILAGLTTAQVGIINEQIQFTQSKAYLGRTGGLVEGSSHDTYGGGVPTMLEGGEFILNREAVRAYGDQISMMSSATGGKPMSIDDSRIVQAISKQNLSTKTPLKAYVLYNDIQDTTKLNKKIEQLARL